MLIITTGTDIDLPAESRVYFFVIRLTAVLTFHVHHPSAKFSPCMCIRSCAYRVYIPNRLQCPYYQRVDVMKTMDDGRDL